MPRHKRAVQADAAIAVLKQELHTFEKQVEQVQPRIMDASNATVITAYERRIEVLECQRRLMAEELNHFPTPKGRF